MPNAIKYNDNEGAETLALQKGNFYIGTGDVSKGPTSSTGFYNGITPPSGGYTIYLNKVGNGPSIYVAANDADLISLSNRIAGQTFATAAAALDWYNSQTDKMVFNIDYPTIVTNGPTFNSANSGSIVWDGTNDYADTGKTATQLGFYDANYTMEAWVYPTSITDDRTMFGTDQTATRQGLHLVFRGGNIYQGHFASDFSAGTVTTNNWYQIVYTFNASNGACQIFKNSVSQGTGTISSFIGTTNILIARWNSGSYFLGNGSIYRIYNRVLSSAEVAQNYNAQKTRFGL